MPRLPTSPTDRLARALQPYLVAVAVVSVGVAARIVLMPSLGDALPFITLFPVVFVVAYFLTPGEKP